MGFGFLLVGYLLSFLFEIAAAPLGIGTVVQILGYLLISRGLYQLREYQKTFLYALFGTAPLFLCAVLRLILEWNRLFAWGITWDAEPLINWMQLAAILIFHTLLLPAVFRLARSVDLPRTANASSRNLILTWIWGIVYLVKIFLQSFEQATRILNPLVIGFQLLAILLNAFLLLSCMKNICPEGEKDPAPHRYRLNVLNRIGERFFDVHEKAADKQKGEIESYLRRRKEKRQKRGHK